MQADCLLRQGVPDVGLEEAQAAVQVCCRCVNNLLWVPYSQHLDLATRPTPLAGVIQLSLLVTVAHVTLLCEQLP